ncbi:hypothetical protein DMENIID0001_125620 [Sergentomyia squamirostris]
MTVREVEQLEWEMAEGNFSRLLSFSMLVQLMKDNNPVLYGKYLKKLKLTANERNILTRLIIGTILTYKYNMEIPRDAHIYMSGIICKVFPDEQPHIYYSPASKGKCPGGKLYNAYHNQRRKYKDVGGDSGGVLRN